MKRILKTTSKLPAEAFEETGLGKVKLLGTSGEHCTFVEAFGLDCKFYYNLSCTKKSKIYASEIGLGHLEVEGDSTYLFRDTPLVGMNDQQELTELVKWYNFDENPNDPDNIFLAYAHVPKTIGELLADSNSIITCHENFIPAAIHIDDNSILARVNGKLKSITFKELADRLDEYSK